MVFEDLEGRTLLLMCANMTRRDALGRRMWPRGLIHEVRIDASGIRLGRHRADLDGLVDPSAGI